MRYVVLTAAELSDQDKYTFEDRAAAEATAESLAETENAAYVLLVVGRVGRPEPVALPVSWLRYDA